VCICHCRTTCCGKLPKKRRENPENARRYGGYEVGPKCAWLYAFVWAHCLSFCLHNQSCYPCFATARHPNTLGYTKRQGHGKKNYLFMPLASGRYLFYISIACGKGGFKIGQRICWFCATCVGMRILLLYIGAQP